MAGLELWWAKRIVTLLMEGVGDGLAHPWNARSLRFQIRTYPSAAQARCWSDPLTQWSLSPLLQAMEPGVTESAELLGRLQLLCLLSGIKGIEELGSGVGGRPEAIVKTQRPGMGPRVMMVRTCWLSFLFVYVYAVMETREVGVATPESLQHILSNDSVFVDSCKKQSKAPPGPVSLAGLWRMVAL